MKFPLMFITPDGKLESNFSWRLGRDTNNVVGALALLQGLQIARSRGINELIVLGDSQIIIQALAENTLPSQMQLHRLIRKIQALVKSFCKVEFFHILRKHNSKVDLATNIGSTLCFGILFRNGATTFWKPP